MALGYDATRHKYTYEFFVNPYSGFEPVIDRQLAGLQGIHGKVLRLGGRIEQAAGTEFARRGWQTTQNILPLTPKPQPPKP